MVIVRQKSWKSRVTRRYSKVAFKPYSHPNEMKDNYEVIRHVPKLMALWLTKFLKRPTNNGEITIKGSALTEVEVMAWKSRASIRLKATPSQSHGARSRFEMNNTFCIP